MRLKFKSSFTFIGTVTYHSIVLSNFNLSFGMKKGVKMKAVKYMDEEMVLKQE